MLLDVLYCVSQISIYAYSHNLAYYIDISRVHAWIVGFSGGSGGSGDV